MINLSCVFIFLVLCQTACGDGVDWISPQFILDHRSNSDPDTASAIKAIVNRARSSAKNGPFTVTKGSITAPSGKKQDYLSWAPYHWPNCNWCDPKGNGKAHHANSAEDWEDGDDMGENYDGSNGNSDSEEPGSSGSTTATSTDVFNDPFDPLNEGPYTVKHLTESISSTDSSTMTSLPSDEAALVYSIVDIVDTQMGLGPAMSQHSTVIGDPLGNGLSAEDRKPTKTKGTSCTPSPTKSISPSATWTTCPYVARDGRVNPDRNQLQALPQLIDFTQSVVDNAIASIFDTGSSSSSDGSSSTAGKSVAQFIEVFLLNPQTGVLPSLEWGQTVRGKDQHGSYMGILDFRDMVKVANAVQILRASRNSAWTSDKDARIIQWTKKYIGWLETGDIGKRARGSANNHSSFYFAQLAALKIMAGDVSGAMDAVQDYFSGPFQEQIVYKGEQPFESTRTRPYHYRCFNLEAMIAVAKLADYLDMDMWNVQTKYQSTIKTAVDYLITLDPGQEDPRAALPIVAASLAAYGDDENETYRKFLEAGGADDFDGDDDEDAGSSRGKGGKKVTKKTYPYKKKSWWLYQQLGSLKHGHGSRTSSKDNGGQGQKRRIDDEHIDTGYLFPVPKQDVLGAAPLTATPVDDADAQSPSQTSSLEDEGAAVEAMSSSDTDTISSMMSGNETQDTHTQLSTSLAEAADLNPNHEGDYWDLAHFSHLSTFHPERPAPFVLTDAVELDEGIYVFWEDIRHLYDHPSRKKRSVWARW